MPALDAKERPRKGALSQLFDLTYLRGSISWIEMEPESS